MNTINKNFKEWLLQADYDYETAGAMFKTGRYVYAVFMCHLALEKTLKGFFVKTLLKDAPKTHNLVFLREQANVKLPDKLASFLNYINDLSVPTRYPEDLKRVLASYNKNKTHGIMIKTKEVLSWLKENC